MSANPQANKRKKERACDGCRRRKTKCDGPWMRQNICTNCIQAHKVCRYVEASKPRGPPKAYVTSLEDRLESLEALLQQIRPDTDFSEELGPPVIRGSWKVHLEPTNTSTSLATPLSNSTSQSQPVDAPTLNSLVSHRQRTTHLMFPRSKRSRTIVPTSWAGGYHLSDDDSTTDASSSSSDTEEMLMTTSHGKMKIKLLANEPDVTPDENAIRFDSKSSTASLIIALQKFKDMHMKETLNPDPLAPSFLDNPTPAQPRRPQYWQTPPWELLYQGDSSALIPNLLLYFPPTDLAETLLSLYFARSNSVFPLLHRPTFDRQWHDGLHHRNIWFTCVCACLFAVASRWCNDDRVLPPDSNREDGELDWQKAGRQYFEVGVEIFRAQRCIFQSASLFEIQSLVLLSMFLRGTNAFPVAWVVVSAGIRMAQDAGAHCKKIYRAGPNADDELWKRAFWHLVAFDRIGSMTLGRACGLAEEDFDLDLPLEVDDEYWEGRQDGEIFFEQPRGVPSRIAAFNHFIKLTQIMAFTMRTMYAIDKPKNYCEIIPIGKENLLRQLSSAMEEWLEATPEHLKWKDNMDNPELSAALFTAYYLTLMLIYRPLITTSSPSPSTMPHKLHPSELSSLMLSANPAILLCTNAARSCARIVEVQLRDGLSNFHIPGVINVAYVGAGLLSYIIWNLKVQEKAQRSECSQDVKPPITQEIEDHLADAHIFMRALEEAKPRWNIVDSMLEQLNASLPGAQPQNQSASDSPRSNYAHFGLIPDAHPWSSTDSSYLMDIQSGQAPQLKHNQHLLGVCSLSGTDHWAHLQLSSILRTYPPNTRESRLHSYNSDTNYNLHPVLINQPRSLSATAPPPYIPDEHPLFLSCTANALRRTSLSNLNARGSHDNHQLTSVEYPSSSSTSAGSSFSTGRSTMKYHDANMRHFDDEASNSHHYLNQTSYTLQKPPLNMGYSRLEQTCLPASTGLPRSAMPPSPSIQDIYDPFVSYQNKV